MKNRLPALVVCVALLLAVLNVAGAVAFIPDRGGDFQMLYDAAAAWASGRSPYAQMGTPTTNLNHPLALLVIAPFLLLSPIHAFFAWTLLSIGTFVAVTACVAPRIGISGWEMSLLTLALTGTAFELGLGQIAFVVMVLLTAAWWCERTSRNGIAGACIGLTCVLKPLYGLFAIVLIWRGTSKAVIACVLTVVVAYAIGWWIAGSHGYAEWITNLRHVTWTWHIFNASIWGAAARMFAVQTPAIGTRWTPLAVSPVAEDATVLFGTVATLFILWRGLKIADTDERYALLALASLLLSPLGWLYNLPVSAGPVFAVIVRRPSRWLWPIGALAVCPYPVLVNQEYGKLGTATVGQISVVVVAGLLIIVYSNTCARVRTEGQSRERIGPAEPLTLH